MSNETLDSVSTTHSERNALEVVEVVHEIFQYLPLCEVLSARAVCHSWRVISQDKLGDKSAAFLSHLDVEEEPIELAFPSRILGMNFDCISGELCVVTSSQPGELVVFTHDSSRSRRVFDEAFVTDATNAAAAVAVSLANQSNNANNAANNEGVAEDAGGAVRGRPVNFSVLSSTEFCFHGPFFVVQKRGDRTSLIFNCRSREQLYIPSFVDAEASTFGSSKTGSIFAVKSELPSSPLRVFFPGASAGGGDSVYAGEFFDKSMDLPLDYIWLDNSEEHVVCAHSERKNTTLFCIALKPNKDAAAVVSKGPGLKPAQKQPPLLKLELRQSVEMRNAVCGGQIAAVIDDLCLKWIAVNASKKLLIIWDYAGVKNEEDDGTAIAHACRRKNLSPTRRGAGKSSSRRRVKHRGVQGSRTGAPVEIPITGLPAGTLFNCTQIEVCTAGQVYGAMMRDVKGKHFLALIAADGSATRTFYLHQPSVIAFHPKEPLAVVVSEDKGSNWNRDSDIMAALGSGIGTVLHFGKAEKQRKGRREGGVDEAVDAAAQGLYRFYAWGSVGVLVVSLLWTVTALLYNGWWVYFQNRGGSTTSLAADNNE